MDKKMNSRNLRTIILATAATAISGCAAANLAVLLAGPAIPAASHAIQDAANTNGPGCASYNPTGKLLIQKLASSSEFCKFNAIYKNTSSKGITPEISAIFFGANGSTISEEAHAFKFTLVKPGQSQTIAKSVSCNKQNISSMRVTETFNDGYGIGICGVLNTTYSFAEQETQETVEEKAKPEVKAKIAKIKAKEETKSKQAIVPN